MAFKNTFKSLGVICVLILTACGGGGGGSSGGSSNGFSTPSIPNSLIAVNATNQHAVSNSAVNSTNGVNTGSSAIFTSLNFDGEQNKSSSVFELGKEILLTYSDTTGVDQLTQVHYALIQDSAPCDFGSFSYVINMANPGSNTLVAGDNFSITFYECTNNTNNTHINGELTFTVTSGNFDLTCDAFCSAVTIDIDFNNLIVDTAGYASTIHGGFSLGVSGNTESVSGTSLFVMVSGGEAVHLTNFSIQSITSGITTSTSVSLTVASTTLNGVIAVTTDPSNPLLQDSDEAHPHSGTIIITGSAGSKLTVIINNITSVDFYLDADGDEVTDPGYPVTVSWTDIENA